jgi:hypothetical protein
VKAGGPGSEAVPQTSSSTLASADYLVGRSVEAGRRRAAVPPTPPAPPPPPPPAPVARPATALGAAGRRSAALADFFADVPSLGYSTVAVSAAPASNGQPRPAAPRR